MDNASIHHVDTVQDLIEGSGARLIFLPPYSPDLNPVEGIFSQIKSMMKLNHHLFEVFSCTRTLLTMLFGMVSVQDCIGHSYSTFRLLLSQNLNHNTLLHYSYFKHFRLSIIASFSESYSSSDKIPASLRLFSSPSCL